MIFTLYLVFIHFHHICDCHDDSPNPPSPDWLLKICLFALPSCSNLSPYTTKFQNSSQRRLTLVFPLVKRANGSKYTQNRTRNLLWNMNYKAPNIYLSHLPGVTCAVSHSSLPTSLCTKQTASLNTIRDSSWGSFYLCKWLPCASFSARFAP